MSKGEVIRRILELDGSAKVSFLVNFAQRDLERHLEVLTGARREGRPGPSASASARRRAKVRPETAPLRQSLSSA